MEREHLSVQLFKEGKRWNFIVDNQSGSALPSDKADLLRIWNIPCIVLWRTVFNQGSILRTYLEKNFCPSKGNMEGSLNRQRNNGIFVHCGLVS